MNESQPEQEIPGAARRQALMAAFGAVLATAAANRPALGQMPGGGPQGGGMPRERGGGRGERGDRSERPADAARCPSAEGGKLPSADQIVKHYDNLRIELALTPEQLAAYEQFVKMAKAYFADELRHKQGARSVSQSGTAQLGKLLDEARNRFAALEELQDAATRFMKLLNDAQRTKADAKLSPVATA